jgi:hypothetical protein
MSRIDGASMLLSLAVASALGCGTETVSPLPPLRYEGEHIRVGTDFEVPICAGNLYDFDREIERIEARLELGAVGKTDMWILADGNLYELYCASHTRGCEAWDSAGGVLVRRRAPDVLWHAIAHDRVNRAARERLSASKGLFVEGLAEGLARAYCEPPIPLEFEGPSADALLAAGATHPDFTFL